MSTNASNCQDHRILKTLKSRSPPWWSNRTRLEKTLCFTTVLIFALILAFIISGFFYGKHTAANLCLTPGCIQTAAEVLSNIDESVEPCTDFYQFACGKWMDEHTIPDDESSFNSLVKLKGDFLKLLKGLLEKPPEDSEPSYVRKIKDFYNSCMNLDAIEEAGTEPLKNVLSTFGGWPVVEGKKWDQNKFDWIQTLVSFKKLGYSHNILFSLSIDIDEMNVTNYIIKLEQPSLALPNRMYWSELGLNDTTTAAYYKKMIEAAKYLGAEESVAEHELLDALYFEMTLADDSAFLYDGDYTNWDRKYSIKELESTVPQIPWLKYFNNVLGSKIYENEILFIESLGFLEKFAALISTTEKRTIANYMLWTVVEESLPFLSKDWRDIELQYNKIKLGKSQEKPRYIECFSFGKELWNTDPLKINTAFAAYYFRHYFDKESKDKVMEIAKYVREDFFNILDEAKWMDKATKAHAKSKANSIQFFIGYPEELLNDTLVSRFLKTLTITNESYYKNIFEIKKWNTEKTLSLFRKQHIKGKWSNYAEIEINAFLDNNDIVMQILPGLLQNPYFNKDRPYYMNFGGIGTTIGHELTHGFDDLGRHYDKDGNLNNWWEEDSDEQFKEKAQCIIEQYSNYTTDIGMKVNGLKTRNENIADNGGMKAAYLAYLSWVKDNGPEKLLPGLNYNQKQLFWISVAHILCGKSRPEAQKSQLFIDDHTPNKFRVLGPMSNLEEFSNDFDCSPNSPMNKQPKCQVW